VKFSVIVCSHRAERRQHIEAHFQRVFAAQPYEFILIPDAKSLCEGYNRGFAQSTGELIIFSHDDIELIPPNAAEVIDAHLRNFDLIGVGGTTLLIDGNWITAGDPYVYSTTVAPEGDDGRYRILVYGAGPLVVGGVKALDGCFMACKRAVAAALPFDEKNFDGFHLYDVDFSYRAYRAGYRLAVCRDLPLIHFSKGNNDAAYHAYKARFEQKFMGMLDQGQHTPWKYASSVCRYEQLAQAASPERIGRLLAALAQAG
jgi:GT2 family glycosyltransferase